MSVRAIILMFVVVSITVGCGGDDSKRTAFTKQEKKLTSKTIKRVKWPDSLVAITEEQKMEMDKIALTSQRIGIKDRIFEKLIRKFADGASNLWENVINLDIKKEKYETTEEFKARQTLARTSALEKYIPYFKTWEPTIVTAYAPTKDIRYKPDKQVAIIGLPAINLPEATIEIKKMMGRETRKAVRVLVAAGPLYYHRWSSFKSVSDFRHRLLGSIRADLPLEKARSMDIVNTDGIVEFTFNFTSINTVIDGIGRKPFPLLQLLSARWIVGSDTLFSYSEGVVAWEPYRSPPHSRGRRAGEFRLGANSNRKFTLQYKVEVESRMGDFFD